MRKGTCKSCGAAVLWIPTAGRKYMPCDPVPVYYNAKPKDGKKRIVTASGAVIACEYADGPKGATGWGYIPHWATCPQADSHRKKERKNE